MDKLRTKMIAKTIQIHKISPYRTQSHSGARYFLTLVDDYSRSVWLYLLPNKQDVSQTIRQFISMVEKQFETSVKTVKSDNGTEFVCLTNYFRDKGIHDAAIQIEVPVVRRGPTTRSGARAIRLGFSKAVQQILDQDVQSGQEELLIEEMIQLKIQDQAGSIEVQDQTGPIQFRSLAQNRTGLTISTCDLGSDHVPIPAGSE